MAQAFFGGVHPNDMKAATNEKAIEQLSPPPAQVVIPMSMHFGAPCTPIVSVGDYVKVGQKIGEFKGLGAPIHASVSGKVVAIEPRPYSMGGNMTSVVIENDYQNTVSEEVKAPADPNALTTEEMIEIVKNAGIVGMGGATFPTHVKISGGIGQVTTVIINGAECEPYITGDHRAMLERTEEIIGGASYLVKMFGVDKAIIGVEDNKKNGIDALNRVIAETKAPVIVVPLHCRYPQGGEKQLCQAITGKQVPPGGLPSAIGNALISVSSNKYVILLIINLVLLVVGCFMDITPAVLIFTPIFLPVVQSFGMDPIHFGIMMVMNLGIGNITPPVGSALFSGCSVADMDMEDMIKPILPFYAAIFVALMLVAYVPWFSMALPTLFGAV